jgi:citrate/tricarballylate utilization protein
VTADTDGAPDAAALVLDATTGLIGLAKEATRQLNICNACRYCEGLCAVYPALERRNVLDLADISQLANLCHDCRACYDACMYTPPHDFDINIPKVLAATRLADYQRYIWPSIPPRLLRGRVGLASGAVVVAALLFIIAVAHAGFGGLVRVRDGSSSPYELIPYPVLLVLMLIPAVFAVVVMIAAGRRFWRATGPSPQPFTATAVLRATWDAATMRYLRGGGGDCYYPEEDKPSPRRRQLHSATAYGFGLCLVSTVAAGIMQDLMGVQPPYPLVSVPVIAGIAGGAGLVVGCVGLLLLKVRSAGVMNVAGMTVKDYGLLSALAFLGFSGLCVLLTRSTPAFGIVLLVHLAAVMVAFASAPYSKFAHVIFRFLALVRDHLERGSGRVAG